jgi:hypothetical protein
MDEVRAATDWKLVIADELAVTPLPTRAELAALESMRAAAVSHSSSTARDVWEMRTKGRNVIG